MIMEAKELMVGNLVYNESGDSVSVDSVSDYSVMYGKRVAGGVIRTGCLTKELSAIPLTEEWLLKLGFRPNEYNGEVDEWVFNYKIKDVYWEINLQVWSNGELMLIFDRGLTGTEIKYVHQLQNLIFAITQRELKI